jgi:hypothetical protein
MCWKPWGPIVNATEFPKLSTSTTAVFFYAPNKLTDVGRAMASLGVEVIFANSPQAKGRIERVTELIRIVDLNTFPLALTS